MTGTETAAAPAAITPSGGEPMAVDLLLKQAGDAIAFERERADRAEAETAALGGRLGAAIAAAVAVERAKAGELLGRIRELAESWTEDDGQGPPTPEMDIQAECGRAVVQILLGGQVPGA